MSDLVSIIIPTYNVEKYVNSAICSCIEQTYRNIEIIVIDDGSTDSTYDEIQRLSLKDLRIKARKKQNGGVSSARNIGLKNMDGDYVLFLDSDDWLEKDAVEILLKHAKRTEHLIACDRKWVTKLEDGTESVINPRFASEQPVAVSKEEALSSYLTGKYSVPSACYKLFKTKIIKENSIVFDESISHGEDGLFVYEYLYHSDGLEYIPERLWNILERPGSASRSKFSEKMISMLDAIDRMIEYGPIDSKTRIILDKYYIKRSLALIATIAKEGGMTHSNSLKDIRNRMRNRINNLRSVKVSTRIRYKYYESAPIGLIGISSKSIGFTKKMLKSILYR